VLRASMQRSVTITERAIDIGLAFLPHAESVLLPLLGLAVAEGEDVRTLLLNHCRYWMPSGSLVR
jgi:hypothetical protein